MTKNATKKKPKYNQSSAIRSALRRSFSRSPVVREVLMDGRREVPKYKKDGSLAAKPSVQYQCQCCNEWVGSTKISVDHIIPVVPTDGSFDPQNPDWNMFIGRLWCPKANLQRICDDCHQEKTNKEKDERKAVAAAALVKLIVEDDNAKD